MDKLFLKGTDGKTCVLPSDILFYKPLVRGVDYWTPADQESIVQQVITALGTPVFGRVDAENNIILSGALADGTYTIKYEDADGNLTEIGTIEVTGEVPYTNLADPTSEDWAVDKRLNSSAALADATGCQTTNFFPCVKGDVIRVKGLDIRYTNSEHTQNARAWFFDEGGTGIVGAYLESDSKIVFDGVDTFTITLDGLTNIGGGHEEDVVMGRLSGMLFDGYTAEDVIITVNEEITNGESESSYTNQIPISIDSDGSVYNGTGYRANTRFSSGGEVSDGMEAGATNPVFTTGYIPFIAGDVIRLKNCYIDVDGLNSDTANIAYYGTGLSSLRIWTYHADAFLCANKIQWSEFLSSEYITATADSNGHVTEFTLNEGISGGYIRLCLGGDPATAIVTINEEITD